MKVENNNTSLPNQDTNASTSPETSAPTNFFFDLISTLYARVIIPADEPKVEGNTDNENNQQSNNEETNEQLIDTQAAISVNPMLENIQAIAEKPVSITEVQSQEDNAKSEMANEIKSMLKPQPNTTVNASKPIISELVSKLNAEKRDVSKLDSAAMLPDQLLENKVKGKNQILEHLSDNQLNLTTEEIQKKILNPSMPQQTIKIESATPSNLTQQTTVILNTSNDVQELQNNKFVNSLVQMGELINHHTKLHASDDVQLPTANVSSDYSAVLNKLKATAPEIHIEKLPTNNIIMHETYSANIKIYPPELGSVLAKLKVGPSGAELIILTENDKVKEIVQSNLNQLREQFQQANINLSNIDVQTSQLAAKDQNDHNKQARENVATREQTDDINQQPTKQENSKRTITSIIDTYA